MKKVSIIIPIYKPDKRILIKLINYLNKNKKRGCEIIKIDGRGGTANAFNRGIKHSKGEIVLIVHQDCIPKEKDFIKKMIKPFEDKEVVIATAKIKDYDTGKEYYPFPPDVKATAYRRSALNKVGGFDSKTYFTGGEDVDIWLKLMRFGKLANVNTTVEHIHPNYFGNKTIEKRRQNGSINGCLFRIWGVKNPFWWKPLIMCCIYPFDYGREFCKAFLTKKQSYRRKDEVPSL